MKTRAWLRRILITFAVIVVTGISLVTVLIVGRQRGWYEPAVQGGPPTVRLITAEQYLTVIHELFGQDVQVDVSFFAPLQRRQGLLTLGAATAEITPGALEQFDRAARTVATQVVDTVHRTTLVPCSPVSPNTADPPCARAFFARVGRYLYRRPLTESELRFQVTTAGNVAGQTGDFYKGLGYSLAGMLLSPRFLYFTEMTEPDPDHAGRVRLDAFSKATRLSLFLWNSPPDDVLLDAAESGALHSRRGLGQQIDRMLASPRLEQAVRAFFSDLLNFDKFDTLAKDSVLYPEFTPTVAVAAKEQILRLITDQLLTRRGDYRDLFTTSLTFIDGPLGPLYRVPVSDPSGWTPYQLDHRAAAGLLTSVGFLAINAHPGVSSPTRRGRAVREILLCQKVPDPPPNVNFTVFEDKSHRFMTNRDRLVAHATDGVCAGCHKLTDPIGLALENFDGAGVFRYTENETPIDASGALDGKAFSDVTSFGRALHDHPALGPCLSNRLYAYGIDRTLIRADRPWLEYIARRFAVHDYRLPELLRDIASSKAFFAISNVIPSDTTEVVAANARQPNRS